jgi:hypothetical protein
MFFTGGVSSFATRFDDLFPRYSDSQGVKKPAVPEQMVALVATAVRFFMSRFNVYAYLQHTIGVFCHI